MVSRGTIASSSSSGAKASSVSCEGTRGGLASSSSGEESRGPVAADDFAALRLATTVQCDADAARVLRELNKKTRKTWGGHENAELHRMKKSDYEATLFRAASIGTAGADVPPKKFANGQAVIQLWASWMKDAEDPPPHYNTKNRPAWFSGEVLAHKGYGELKYAGVTGPPDGTGPVSLCLSPSSRRRRRGNTCIQMGAC